MRAKSPEQVDLIACFQMYSTSGLQSSVEVAAIVVFVKVEPTLVNLHDQKIINYKPKTLKWAQFVARM